MNQSHIYVYHSSLLAQAYDCGTYGADSFNETSCVDASTSPLANTGESFWTTLLIAGILIAVPAAYLVKKLVSRRKK